MGFVLQDKDGQIVGATVRDVPSKKSTDVFARQVGSFFRNTSLPLGHPSMKPGMTAPHSERISTPCQCDVGNLMIGELPASC